MSTLTRNQARPFVEFADWLESPLTVFRQFGAQTMRIEDHVSDGHYTLRAEIPGVDPEKDIAVTVSDGTLTIKAERHEAKEDKDHSEFRYGAFVRRIALPAGADEEHVQATYDKGILEVTVDLRQEVPERRVPVKPLPEAKQT